MKNKKNTLVLNSNRKIFNLLKLKYSEKISEEEMPIFRRIKYLNEAIRFFVFHSFIALLIFFMAYNNEHTRAFYDYSFGLFFGILIYPAILFSLVYYWFNFSALFMRKKVYSYFSRVKKVDIKVLKKQVLFLLVTSFFAFALLVHISTHYYYNSAFDFKFTNESLSSVFTNGWYARFTVNGPNTNNNIGFFFDTIFNILYYISISGVVPILILVVLILYTVFKMRVINFREWRKKFSSRKTIVNIWDSYQKHSKIFYKTRDIVFYFIFIIECSKELKYNYQKNSYKKLMQYLYKNLRNIDIAFMIEHCVKQIRTLKNKKENERLKNLNVQNNQQEKMMSTENEEVLVEEKVVEQIEEKSSVSNNQITYDTASLVKNEDSNLLENKQNKEQNSDTGNNYDSEKEAQEEVLNYLLFDDDEEIDTDNKK